MSAYNESDHPRDPRGQYTNKPGANDSSGVELSSSYIEDPSYPFSPGAPDGLTWENMSKQDFHHVKPFVGVNIRTDEQAFFDNPVEAMDWQEYQEPYPGDSVRITGKSDPTLSYPWMEQEDRIDAWDCLSARKKAESLINMMEKMEPQDREKYLFKQGFYKEEVFPYSWRRLGKKYPVFTVSNWGESYGVDILQGDVRVSVEQRKGQSSRTVWVRSHEDVDMTKTMAGINEGRLSFVTPNGNLYSEHDENGEMVQSDICGRQEIQKIAGHLRAVGPDRYSTEPVSQEWVDTNYPSSLFATGYPLKEVCQANKELLVGDALADRFAAH